MSNEVIAAMIAILTTPIVSRLYGPADFGIAAQFISVVSILATIGAIGYETAFVLPRERKGAPRAVYRILFAFSIVLLRCLDSAHCSMFTGFARRAGWTKWLLPVGLLVVGGVARAAG
jgi:O-antigen/teichoic acid export membrane protein